MCMVSNGQTSDRSCWINLRKEIDDLSSTCRSSLVQRRSHHFVTSSPNAVRGPARAAIKPPVRGPARAATNAATKPSALPCTAARLKASCASASALKSASSWSSCSKLSNASRRSESKSDPGPGPGSARNHRTCISAPVQASHFCLAAGLITWLSE
jgi:hypothetical protein